MKAYIVSYENEVDVYAIAELVEKTNKNLKI